MRLTYHDRPLDAHRLREFVESERIVGVDELPGDLAYHVDRLVPEAGLKWVTFGGMFDYPALVTETYLANLKAVGLVNDEDRWIPEASALDGLRVNFFGLTYAWSA